jgi:hypothetical protein
MIHRFFFGRRYLTYERRTDHVLNYQGVRWQISFYRRPKGHLPRVNALLRRDRDVLNAMRRSR